MMVLLSPRSTHAPGIMMEIRSGESCGGGELVWSFQQTSINTLFIPLLLSITTITTIAIIIMTTTNTMTATTAKKAGRVEQAPCASLGRGVKIRGPGAILRHHTSSSQN